MEAEGFDAEVTVRRTRYASEESGWAVVQAALGDGEEVVLVGPLTHLEARERVQVIGSWVDDSRYGLQVKVREARPLPPAGRDAVISYLRRVRHVGVRRAHSLVDRHGPESVLEAIDRDPGRAFAAAGIRGERMGEAVSSWNALRVMRELHLLLAPHGVAYLIPRIQAEYGPAAHRTVRENPYELTSVFGVGFTIADRIAGATGPTESRAPARARAGAHHVLLEAERSGSTCLPEGLMIKRLAALLDAPVPEGLIAEMMAAEELVVDEDFVYRASTAALEAELAERIAELLAGVPSPALQRESEADEAVLAELTDEQRRGVVNALTQRLSLITGGPGTGKTASIRAIAGAATARGARTLLVAPTGRAAIRMTESSGIAARTVHSALGWIPGEGPEHDEEDPLPADLVILDEASMGNLELMVALLRAVGRGTHLVLVGDADQLAPVGAGKPFAELVAGGTVPASALTHIFRQAAGSMIVQGAHAVRRGHSPDFSHREGMRRDLFLIERADPRTAHAEIISLVAERLPAHFGVDPVADIQVFAPVYRGELGIDALNTSLRAALNPEGQPVAGGRLRIGDKVMMTGRNLHELGLMNGTLLRLLDEVSGTPGEDDAALLLAAEEAVFRLAPEEAASLRLAYACSVHRGQGIELPVAVVVAHPAAGAFFLRREMLYTAITRAQRATVVVGTREVVAAAARIADTGSRHSRLAERLIRENASTPPPVSL